MKRISFCLLIILLGCHKESDERNTIREEFVGNYCGRILEFGRWSPLSATVQKMVTSENMVVFDYLIGVDNVPAIVENNNLVIPEITQRKVTSTTAAPWGEITYYDLTLSGNGVLDVSNYLLRMNIILKESYDVGDDRVRQFEIEMYNSSKYSYNGTFTGDSATVIISQYNDSLLLSIVFQEDRIPSGWNNIKAIENQCIISFSVDSIKDISLGELYTLSGGAYKLGNSLRFILFAYHGSSSLYTYDFTVTKSTNLNLP